MLASTVQFSRYGREPRCVPLATGLAPGAVRKSRVSATPTEVDEALKVESVFYTNTRPVPQDPTACQEFSSHRSHVPRPRAVLASDDPIKPNS